MLEQLFNLTARRGLLWLIHRRDTDLIRAIDQLSVVIRFLSFDLFPGTVLFSI